MSHVQTYAEFEDYSLEVRTQGLDEAEFRITDGETGLRAELNDCEVRELVTQLVEWLNRMQIAGSIGKEKEARILNRISVSSTPEMCATCPQNFEGRCRALLAPESRAEKDQRAGKLFVLNCHGSEGE